MKDEWKKSPDGKAWLAKYMSSYRLAHPEYTAREKIRDRIFKAGKRRENKIRLIQVFGGKCIYCGYNKNAAAMEFHHRNAKEKEINFNIYLSFDKMLKEAKKCDLVCANCHREIENPELALVKRLS